MTKLAAVKLKNCEYTIKYVKSNQLLRVFYQICERSRKKLLEKWERVIHLDGWQARWCFDLGRCIPLYDGYWPELKDNLRLLK